MQLLYKKHTSLPLLHDERIMRVSLPLMMGVGNVHLKIRTNNLQHNMEKINYKDLQCNPFSLVNRMMLLTAGNQEVGYNVMTISWGGFGVLWDKPVATIYVRPSRHTMNFLNQCDHFTLSVLSDEYKKHMVYCGTVSGVRQDKFVGAGLTPVVEDKCTYVGEAELVFKCRKLYVDPLDKKKFIDKDVFDKNYEKGDIHILFIGEIEEVLAANDKYLNP